MGTFTVDEEGCIPNIHSIMLERAAESTRAAFASAISSICEEENMVVEVNDERLITSFMNVLAHLEAVKVRKDDRLKEITLQGRIFR